MIYTTKGRISWHDKWLFAKWLTVNNQNSLCQEQNTYCQITECDNEISGLLILDMLVKTKTTLRRNRL